MRQLVLAVAALVPLASAAQAPTEPAPGSTGPQPIAIEPAPPPPERAPEAPVWRATRGSYLVARAGMILPRHDDVEAFDDGLAVEAAAGTRLLPNLAVELGIGYLRMSLHHVGYAADVGAYELEETLSAVPVVAAARVFARSRSAEVYALAGTGVYLWSLDGTVTSTLEPPYSASDTDTTVGYHLGAGFAGSVTREVTVGLEARYLLARATFFGRSGHVDSAIVTASLGYGFF